MSVCRSNRPSSTFASAAASLMLVALLLLPGCGSRTPAPQPDSPGAAVQQFFRDLDEGRYDEATAMYDRSTRDMLSDPEVSSPDAFAEWADGKTHDGSLAAVEVVSTEETQPDTSAVVRYELVFDDGSREAGEVTLTREDGSWKLGFVG